MRLSQIKQQLIGASFKYHLDSQARLMSVQIGDLPFRLVRTLSEDGMSMKNYVIKTKDNYDDFRYDDIRKGIVQPISIFSLSSIKNSKSRKRFADKIGNTINSYTDDFSNSLEEFMSV